MIVRLILQIEGDIKANAFYYFLLGGIYMNDIILNVKLKSEYDFINYQSDIFYKQKVKSNYQTPFSLIEEIIIQNKSINDFADLKIVFTCNHPILTIKDVFVSDLFAKTTSKITQQINIDFDFASLYKLSEAMPLTLNVELFKENEDVPLTCNTYQICLNPIDQIMSGGVKDICLLSCFVTPNIQLIDNVINDAQQILMQERKDQPAFVGYQANSIDSVRQEMKVIYQALQKQGIAYSNPPASFNKFQRIRTPSYVLKNKKGTCLDLSILYCACLENIGLKPILILIKNHAFVGCFLHDTNFEDYQIESYETIVNKSSQGNMSIELVECTGFPITSQLSFNDSTVEARKHLELYHDVFNAIDISRCHNSFYRPIPTFNDDEPIIINMQGQIDQEKLVLQAPFNKGVFEVESFKGDKFEYWAKKLLDLNLKNRLINFKLNRQALQVLVYDTNLLFEHFKTNESINIVFNDINLKDGMYQSGFSDLYYDDETKGLYHVASDDKTYKSLIRKANLALDETGSNVLYLSFGLIHFTPEKSKISFLAPLFLIPAKGKMRSSNGIYQLDFILDEISINTTVLEYIKQTCQIGFDDLYGLKKEDIIKKRVEIINAIRQRSSRACQISVDENKVYLSIFSFAHYIMWDDIKRRQDILMQNKIIQALVNNTLVENKVYEDNLETNPNEIAAPLGADSSQIKAIIDAEKGESFVLDGPPGTGKSQTIVNMIINAIYHNKTVLFVAEKMAALDVVKKRIDDLNLGFLCLELHSNKSNKKDMLEHIGHSLEYEKIASPTNFDQATQDLMKRRLELNDLIAKMSKNTYGFSLYDCIISYLNIKDANQWSYPSYDQALNLTKKDILDIVEKLSYLNTLVSSRGELFLNPYHSFDYLEIDKNKIEQLKTFLKSWQKEISYLKTSFNDIGFAFSKAKASNKNLLMIYQLVKYINDNEILFLNFTYQDIKKINDDLNSLFEYGLKIQANHETLSRYFNDDIYNLDYETINDKIVTKKSKFIAKHKLIRCFKPFLKVKKIKYKNQYDPFFIFDNIKTSNEYIKQIDGFQTPIKYLFNNDGCTYLSCDYQGIKTKLSNSVFVYNLLDQIYEQLDFEQFKFAIEDIKKLYNQKNEYGSQIYCFIQSYERFINIKNELSNQFNFQDECFKYNSESNYLSLLNQEITLMIEQDYLANVIPAYNLIFKQLKELNFPVILINEYRLAKFDISQLKDRFLAMYYQRLIVEYTKDDFFKQFNSIIFNDTIKKYGQAIDEYTTLIIKETASRATKNYPLSNINYLDSSKIAQLNRYIRNGGKKTTIRNLLIEFEDLIKTICPVFLMSPMSAAQYLSANSKKFDIVIFDEASQIPTAEAVGAISRGNSLIVAGDPEQMPPTNFFKTNFDSVDDEYEYVDDLESLLDDCLAIKMKRNRLLWHYRSKHESLIAFSNNNFYNHSLYTFPSPDNNFSKIEFHYLKDGVYEKGINVLEAKEIVKKVKEIFKDPNLCHKSIGIIAFNIKQCELILGMINDLFDKHPEFEKIDNENEQKLFVKNLENVQGDERDIIIFSIGFGYNKHKKFSMMFGPLSLEKGERRLNVAITRAREKMIVYSSIKGNDINVETAKNKGSSVLKDFLNYAEKGHGAIVVENANQTQPKVGIEKLLQKDLKEYGIDSDINVGDSKFRINLCIKNDQGDYVLGILCDGQTYMETPTCRDRNYVQNNMLFKLNWKVIRVYTYDYFNNHDMVINDILTCLKNIEVINVEHQNKHAKEDVIFEKKIVEAYKHKKPYIEKMPLRICNYEHLDFFYDEVLQYLINVIDIEGPIAKSLLLERFKTAYGISRAGNIAKATFESMIKTIKKLRYSQQELLDEFFYGGKDNPTPVDYFRESNYTIRSIEQIPSVEIAYALIDIIQVQGEVSIDDALKALCNLFGYEKVTSSTLNKMKKQIQYILDNYSKFVLNKGMININK